MRAERDAELADFVAHPSAVPLEARPIEEQGRCGCVKNGAQGRNRTTDTVIFSHVLYQLSYLGSRDGQGARSSERLP